MEGLEQAEIVNPLLKSDFYGQIGDLNYFLEKGGGFYQL